MIIYINHKLKETMIQYNIINKLNDSEKRQRRKFDEHSKEKQQHLLKQKKKTRK